MIKPRILITDDESCLRDLLFVVLKDEYRVHFTSNGLEATRFLQENSADLVLLDLVMPVLNGIEVLNWIKENGIDVPVLMMSSLDIQKIPHPFGDLGIKGFISKPFEIDPLLRRIRETIQSDLLEEGPTVDRRVLKRRYLLERRKGERRSWTYVDPGLIFDGEALRRKGMERRTNSRRAMVDRRIE